ncbi:MULTISPECIES: helix-turn-helix domain-containing protein [unclassified Maridesulfovibrio]|uniref:helix-turn-helix domain-containing protein n=1 Tax=unclassified Maridesulfovibrio TaxID=2794999 RepID=UPI003B3E99EF
MKEHDCRASIARRLKTFRNQEKLSLDAVAGMTGVSKAMLGQIERKESVPTISTLWKIAGGLGVSFSSFFEKQSPGTFNGSLFPNDPDMRVDIVFPYNPATHMEVFNVTLTNHHHQISSAHQSGVVEHVIVMQGDLELVYENRTEKLTQGQSLRFYADIPHEYKAVSGEAVFQNIICYT